MSPFSKVLSLYRTKQQIKGLWSVEGRGQIVSMWEMIRVWNWQQSYSKMMLKYTIHFHGNHYWLHPTRQVSSNRDELGGNYSVTEKMTVFVQCCSLLDPYIQNLEKTSHCFSSTLDSSPLFPSKDINSILLCQLQSSKTINLEITEEVKGIGPNSIVICNLFKMLII